MDNDIQVKNVNKVLAEYDAMISKLTRENILLKVYISDMTEEMVVMNEEKENIVTELENLKMDLEVNNK